MEAEESTEVTEPKESTDPLEPEEPDWIAMLLALMIVAAIMFITLYEPIKRAVTGD
jgi:hypothetical protein